MPSKDLMNSFICSLISMAYILGSEVSQAQEKAGSAVHSPCDEWQNEQESLVVEHICIVATRNGDERPLYVQNIGSTTYRFLFSQKSLALVIQQSELSELRASPSIRKKLLGELTVDRIALWHEDAVYWWRWLERSDHVWSGEED